MFFRRILFALLVVALLAPASPAQRGRDVSLLLVNGKVFTADERGTVAEAVKTELPSGSCPKITGSASDLIAAATCGRSARLVPSRGVVAECASSRPAGPTTKASLSVPICSGFMKLDKNLRLISATVEPASRPECGIAIDMKGSGPSK